MKIPTQEELKALRKGLRKRKCPLIFDGMWCSEPGIGVKGYESSTWYGIVAPINTPLAIQILLNKEIVLILKDPELKKIYDEDGLELVGNSQLEFKTFIQKEIDKWRKVAASASSKKESKLYLNN